MRIDIQCDRNIGVAQPLGNDLRIETGSQELGRVRVLDPVLEKPWGGLLTGFTWLPGGPDEIDEF